MLLQINYLFYLTKWPYFFFIFYILCLMQLIQTVWCPLGKKKSVCIVHKSYNLKYQSFLKLKNQPTFY